MIRFWWLFVAVALTGCANKEVCEINYRGCCLTETPKELKLKGDNCWPKGEFIFNAGDVTHLIDAGKAQPTETPK